MQNRIENAMGKQLNFVSLHTCTLVSCIQPKYVIFAQQSLMLGYGKWNQLPSRGLGTRVLPKRSKTH